MTQNNPPKLPLEALALQVLESSPDAFAIIDQDFRYLFANQAFVDQFGMTVEKIIDLSVADVVGEEVFDASAKHNLIACLDGETVQYEREFSPEEPNRWVNLTLTPISDENGNVCVMVVNIRDITKRREETDTMRRALTLMQQAESIAAIGHWLWDMDAGQAMEYSDGLPALLGLSSDDLQATLTPGEIFDRAHPEDKSRMRDAMQLCVSDGQPYDEEFRIERPDGKYRWLHEVCTPFEWVDGRVTKILGTTRDVTREKEESEALRQSAELTDQAVRIAGIGHMLWDLANDVCLECNDIIPEIHGLSHEEYIRRGSSVNGMLHVVEEDREWLAAEYAKATVPGGTCDIRYRIIRDDGEVRWVHELFAPYEVVDGKVVTAIGTMRDITAEVLEREELERERFFIKQVEDVTNVGLFVWDEEVGRNIYCSENLAAMHGMTHEEIMLSVVGEQADVELVFPEDRERVAEAYEKCRLHGDPIDVEYRVVHPEKGIRWYNEVAVRRTLGDSGQLVTMGLLYDITERRKSEERFQTYELLASQAEKLGKLGYWIWDVNGEQFSYCSEQIPIMHGVADTGNGIPEDAQDGLFQAFCRLGAENTDIEGTGIGLVVCKDLIELMDGEIDFESVADKGSTFWIELPMSVDQSVAPDAGGSSKPTLHKNALPDIKGTMLYVEDNPANLKLMELIVSNIDGLSMFSAHNAELGLELARAKKPDLIILDINLPGMSGLAALKELREMKDIKDIPVLALSAGATKKDVTKALDAGFQRYLTKPIQIEEMTDAIISALQKEK